VAKNVDYYLLITKYQEFHLPNFQVRKAGCRKVFGFFLYKKAEDYAPPAFH